LTLNSVEDRQEIDTNNHQFDAIPSVKFRSPNALDGHAVAALIKHSPPLDINSTYCNLLQCSHFAQTCVVAETNDTIVGWLSAYIPPNQPDHIFIWQVAVHPAARGKGLAKYMLHALLSRQALLGIRYLITTITLDNQASWGLFERFAKSHQLNLKKSPHFEKETHFQGVHDTEFLVEIGPFEIQDVINNQGGQHA
jgi:L-2,4-diaminobutyric acid acetyltransferase